MQHNYLQYSNGGWRPTCNDDSNLSVVSLEGHLIVAPPLLFVSFSCNFSLERFHEEFRPSWIEFHKGLDSWGCMCSHTILVLHHFIPRNPLLRTSFVDFVLLLIFRLELGFAIRKFCPEPHKVLNTLMLSTLMYISKIQLFPELRQI